MIYLRRATLHLPITVDDQAYDRALHVRQYGIGGQDEDGEALPGPKRFRNLWRLVAQDDAGDLGRDHGVEQTMQTVDVRRGRKPSKGEDHHRATLDVADGPRSCDESSRPRDGSVQILMAGEHVGSLRERQTQGVGNRNVRFGRGGGSGTVHTERY